MIRLLSLVLLTAVCSSTAIPVPENAIKSSFKRQLDLNTLMGLIFSSNPGKMKGEPGGSELFISMARMMGASNSSAGAIQGFMRTVLNGGYGIVSDPTGAAPRRVTLQSKTGIDGAKAVKIRYGPYRVPGTSHKNLLGERGMLSNYPHPSWEKPCSGACTILGISPGLEYADGKSANIDTGMWLHHMVLLTTGPERRDYTCEDRDVSLPHAVVGTTPRKSERIFASGNERPSVLFSDWGVKDAGYRLNSADQFDALLELMNENLDDKIVYVTMTYDIVDGHGLPGDVRVVWLDVRQCGTSEVNPPKGKNKFSLDYNWSSNVDGQIIGAFGHLHDGGKRVVLTTNNLNCTSDATYGARPEYVQKSAPGIHAHGALTHISDMGTCRGNIFPEGHIASGQTWNMVAEYDFDQFQGMKYDDGSWDEVMGIALMFVRITE